MEYSRSDASYPAVYADRELEFLLREREDLEPIENYFGDRETEDPRQPRRGVHFNKYAEPQNLNIRIAGSCGCDLYEATGWPTRSDFLSVKNSN